MFFLLHPTPTPIPYKFIKSKHNTAINLRLREEQKENVSEQNITENKNVIPDAKQFLSAVEKKEAKVVDNSHLSLRQLYDILLANSLQGVNTENQENAQGQFLVDDNLEDRQREMMEKQEQIEHLEKYTLTFFWNYYFSETFF